jgi:hypothetical protein
MMLGGGLFWGWLVAENEWEQRPREAVGFNAGTI